MKTPLQTLLEMVEKSPNQTMTKENVKYAITSLLETEKTHLINMADSYAEPLAAMGMKVRTGQQLFDVRYNNKNNG